MGFNPRCCPGRTEWPPHKEALPGSSGTAVAWGCEGRVPPGSRGLGCWGDWDTRRLRSPHGQNLGPGLRTGSALPWGDTRTQPVLPLPRPGLKATSAEVNSPPTSLS